MQLTPQEESFFREAIHNAISNNQLPLPSPLRTDEVFQSKYYKYEMRGLYDLRFVIRTDSIGALYVDFFLMTDEADVHARIESSGKTKLLENHEINFGQIVYDDKGKTKRERDTMMAHNETIDAILREKGLL